MARLYLNQREISLPGAGFSSLNEVVKHVEQSHLDPQSVIRQIHVDGSPITPAKSGSIPQSFFENVDHREKIEIFTGTIAEVVRDSIRESMDYLDRVKALTSSLSEGFQNSPGPGEFENLKQMYEGFYWINLLVDRIQTTFGIDPATVIVLNVDAREHQRKFVSIMKQLVEAQLSNDFLLVADLLDYEVRVLVPIWKEMLEKYGERISHTH